MSILLMTMMPFSANVLNWKTSIWLGCLLLVIAAETHSDVEAWSGKNRFEPFPRNVVVQKRQKRNAGQTIFLL